MGFKKIPYLSNVMFEVEEPPYNLHHRTDHILYEISFVLTIGKKRYKRISMLRLPHGYDIGTKGNGWKSRKVHPRIPGQPYSDSDQKDVFELIQKNPVILLREYDFSRKWF